MKSPRSICISRGRRLELRRVVFDCHSVQELAHSCTVDARVHCPCAQQKGELVVGSLALQPGCHDTLHAKLALIPGKARAGAVVVSGSERNLATLPTHTRHRTWQESRSPWALRAHTNTPAVVSVRTQGLQGSGCCTPRAKVATGEGGHAPTSSGVMEYINRSNSSTPRSPRRGSGGACGAANTATRPRQAVASLSRTRACESTQPHAWLTA